MSNLNKPETPIRDLNEHPGPFGLTIRHLAAIALRVPMSGDPELNAMIREARRLDIATAAMQGMLADIRNPDVAPANVSEWASRHADALLSASER